MDSFKSGQESAGDADRPAGGERAVLQALVQRGACHQAHDCPGDAVFEDEVVDGDDVGVIAEFGGVVGFAFGAHPPLSGLGIAHRFRQPHLLDRDVDAQDFIPCAPDAPKPPLPSTSSSR